jgi:Mrp family chromosome partitioning ATPase
MRVLMLEAAQEYDMVVLDSPPMMNVADGRVLAAKVDAVVLVVKGGETPRELVQLAHGNILNVGGHVIGVVLNNLDLHADHGYYSYYSYETYGAREFDQAGRGN